MNKIIALQKELQQFAADRDWDQFHSPKNLSMALNVEASELLECFQWLTEEQSKNLDPDELKSVSEEVADIFIYLLKIADKLEIDLISEAKNKMVKNAKKYPIEKAKGNAKKYTELDG